MRNHFDPVVRTVLTVSPAAADLGVPLARAHALYQANELPADLPDVRRIRLYDLRHTAATPLFERGVPAKAVSEMLGHSKITVTMDTYSHVVPSMR